MNPRRTLLLWCLGLTLAACGGGSGSTGLITSETVLIDDVRRTGTCGEFDGAPYCATDSANATAPGGQSASVVASGGPTPVRTGTPAFSPTAGGPTATPGSAPSPTPGGSTPSPPSTASAAATTTPAPAESATPGGPTATPTPGVVPSVTVAVSGFASGAACATAARSAGSDDVWRTGPLTAVDASGAPVAYPLPAGVATPFDLALVCFDHPPAQLPAALVTLADAEPTVVFVLPTS